jgi:hypothetical protein
MPPSRLLHGDEVLFSTHFDSEGKWMNVKLRAY